MSIKDLTIKEIEDIKREISCFIKSEFNALEENEINNIKFILKKIVFLKYLVIQSGDYRFKAIISDMMYLLNTINLGEVRYYYFNMRSIIEHSLRIINNIETTDTITNSSIMELTQEAINEKNLSINIALIKDKYNKSCLYIHGNENSNMKLAEHYHSCILNVKKNVNISKKLNVLVKLLNELLGLILITQNLIIDGAFHRRKSILKFLVGEKLYEEFISYVIE